VVIVGLPGDDEHAAAFAQVAAAWKSWLTEQLDFAPERVWVCSGPAEEASTTGSATESPPTDEPDAGANSLPATRAALEESFESLAGSLQPQDSLWVFFLGHGSYDGRRAFFHVPGPDPDGALVAGWLDQVPCREQVVWLTQTCSGWWLRPLSKPGRIVLSATAADLEENETEFPHALATIAARSPAELDADADGTVSLLELAQATAREVESRFAADKRLPTEHAHLDDDGNGVGTELLTIEPLAVATTGPPAAAPAAAQDGAVAAALVVPYRSHHDAETAPDGEPAATSSPAEEPAAP
jgi:hypothetical protein